MIKKILFSITILLILPTIIYATLFDTEQSNSNTFSATTLDSQFTPSTMLILDITDEGQRDSTMSLENIGNLPTSNNQSIELVSNPVFFSKVNVTVKLNGVIQYTGSLGSLNLTDHLDQNSSDLDSLQFILSISEEDLELTAGQKLEFKIINTSYQQGGLSNTGFFDKEVRLIEVNNSTIIPEVSEIISTPQDNPFF